MLLCIINIIDESKLITSTQIGNNGRLGNQIFQFATLYSVGFSKGIDVCIPAQQELTAIFKMPGIKISNDVNIKHLYKEPSNEFNPGVFLVPDNTDITGYFQAGSYFNHTADNIRKMLTFKDDIMSESKKKMEKFAGSPVCSIHIRRGDYLNLSNFHTNLDMSYYNTAMQIVRHNVPNSKFVVFSDDPAWCKSIMPDEIHVDDSSQEISLCMMSLCPMHIIANSSFSWWGAWLSKSQAVVAPKLWFANDGPKTWQSVYEQGWVVI